MAHTTSAAFQAWRQRTFNQLILLGFALATPVVLADIITSLQRERPAWAIFSAVVFGVMGAMALLRSHYRARLTISFVVLFIYTGATLFNVGLIGAGRIHAIFLVVLSAMLLPQRRAIGMVALIGLMSALILLGQASGALMLSAATVARAIEPQTITINLITLLMLIVGIAQLTLSLIHQLTSSLSRAEDALAERDALNSQLKQLVAERTSALQQSESLLQGFLDHVPSALYVKDLSGRYLITNTYMQRGHGLSAEQLRGRRDVDLFGATAIPWRKHEQAVIDSGQEITCESIANLVDGPRIYLEIKFPLRDAAGAISALGGIAIDITDRKRADEALARQLALQRALADCSHLLLSCGFSDPQHRATLDQALRIVLQAVGGDYALITQYSSDQNIEQLAHSSQILALVRLTGMINKHIETAAEIADMPDELNVWKSGGSFNGPLAGRFPDHPVYTRYLEENQVQAAFIQALKIEGRTWGHILIIDHRQARTWDAAAVQAIQTAADMIVSFSEGWRTAQALREREGLLSGINDALPGGYVYQVIQRDDGSYEGYTYVSAGIEPLLGLTPAQVLTNDDALNRTVIPDDHARVAAADIASVRTRSTFDVELRRRKADGQIGWFHIRSVPYQTLPGGRTLWSGICLEITARKEIELALARAKEVAEAADAAKTAFLANMSHEIRTPLNAVIGMADLLLGTSLTPQQREYAATISTAGQALLSLISDILDLARIEAGHLDLDMQPFDLRACLIESRDLVAHAAAEKGLRLTCQIDASLPAGVVGDAARLRQVLINLLSNAVKFTSAGEVSLQADAFPLDDDRQRIEISVCDSGIGISPDKQRQIFEPFVQADRSTARRYGGTGLGLAICRRIVGLMDGQIHLESAPGAGATFSVTIPFRLAAPPPAPAQISDAPQAMTAQPLHILVAEDNPINQQVTRQMLSRLGHTVIVVTSGQAAIDAVLATPFDVVLMDVQMPGMDGEEATRRIRALGLKICQPYVIALTANALTGDRERFLRAGMDDYLSKPVRQIDLWRSLAGAPAPSATAVNMELMHTFLETLGSDRAEAAAFVIQMFEREVYEQLLQLDAAITAGDSSRARKEAHRQRGGYLQIGARALAEQCRRIEYADQSADLTALGRHLWGAYHQTLSALRQL